MADEKQTAQRDPKAEKWVNEIACYEREFGPWTKRAKAITKRYRDYDDQEASKKSQSDFNILWSNVQVLMPATFARLPQPDVSRRWRDNDPVGRVAALLLERALSFEIEHYPDYRSAMKNSVLDRFLGGRGTSWVRYEPHFSPMDPPPNPEAGETLQVTDDADEANPYEEVSNECAPVDYVHWKDFGHTLARTWEEVTGVWRKTYLTRETMTKRFGEKGKDIPLDSKPTSMNDSTQRAGGAEQQSLACVYEICDKATGTFLWLAKSTGEILDERADPLKLANFFPCARPLYATTTTDNLVPVPDYKLYQDQAKQLDKLAAKISGLIDMLEVRGVYDKAVPALARMFKEAGNGDLIPVDNWAAFAEKNGLKGAIDLFDIAPIVAALNEAYAAQEVVKNAIYEIMGVSDITRGATDPGETLGAQKLKGQYGNMRLRSKQDEVALFATELLQIKAQIMCQQFQPDIFLRIAAADQLMPEDQQYIGPALQLLMGERAMNPEADTSKGPLSSFRVEVSTDSMVQMDEAQERAESNAFLGAVSDYMEKAVPLLEQAPQLAPLVVGLMKFGVSRFKVGRTVEGMLDAALDQMTKQAAQPQPPKPDPEQIKAEAAIALEDKKLANAQALEQQRMQNDASLAANEQQVQAQQNAHQQSLEAQRDQQQAVIDAQLEQQRLAFDERLANVEAANAERLEQQRMAMEAQMNARDNAVKLQIAELQAQTAKYTADKKPALQQDWDQ